MKQDAKARIWIAAFVVCSSIVLGFCGCAELNPSNSTELGCCGRSPDCGDSLRSEREAE